MPSRRTVLAGVAAAAALPALPSILRAQTAIAPAVPAIRERTRAFLAALAPEKATRARFGLGSDTWLAWNYFGTVLIKPGIRFEEMEPSERDSGTDLLVAMLSPAGFEKVERIRALQDVLAAMAIGPADRNSSRYSIAVFGEPTATGYWGLRLEGHHLELTLTLHGDEVVAVTPSAFSCNPNDVRIGPFAGSTAIGAEEQLARRLFADLSAADQGRARIRDDAFTNIAAVAGRETIFETRAGIPAADLSPAQLELLWQIVDVYVAEHWPQPVAAAQLLRVREGDQAAVHFAWAGGNVDDTRLYYRLHGDTFLIELAAVDVAAQHLHTIYHDTERTLGRHVI